MRLGVELGDTASTSALTVNPSTVGASSVLNIATITRSKDTDSNNKKFKKGDCLIVRFNEIEEHTDYAPFPNAITSCNFDDGEITCERLSNTEF